MESNEWTMRQAYTIYAYPNHRLTLPDDGPANLALNQRN